MCLVVLVYFVNSVFQGYPYFLCTEGRLFLKFQCKDMDFLCLQETVTTTSKPCGVLIGAESLL